MMCVSNSINEPLPRCYNGLKIMYMMVPQKNYQSDFSFVNVKVTGSGDHSIVCSKELQQFKHGRQTTRKKNWTISTQL